MYFTQICLLESSCSYKVQNVDPNTLGPAISQSEEYHRELSNSIKQLFVKRSKSFKNFHEINRVH